MSRRYRHASAMEGIRELITELWKRADREKGRNVLIHVYSMKRIHLVAAGCEPPRAILIRPANEFTVGYTTRVPCEDPAVDDHIEIVRTDDGQLYFRENGNVFTTSELATKLIGLIYPDTFDANRT